MKVLLVYPRHRFQSIPEPVWLPLGLSFIAAALREKGHQVMIWDRLAGQVRYGFDMEKVNQAMLADIQAFQPDLIGFNTVGPLIYDTVECAGLIREEYNGLMIAGGHHVTALPELTLNKIPALNGVVRGEGEITMLHLAEGYDPEKIPGLWWRREHQHIHISEPEQIHNLDEIPFPALDLLDMNFYTRRGKNVIRGHYLSAVSMMTSRGCVRKCEFCSESLTYGRGVRFHSPAYVGEWMQQVLRDYPKVNGIYFHDNDFLVNPQRTEEICENILARGLEKKMKWAIQARAERIEPQVLKLLHRAGCVLIEIGVESARQELLDQVGKGSTVEMNEQAISWCKKAGISVHAYMLTRVEGETISDLEERLAWVKRVRPTTFSWHPLEIHPGTRLYNRLGQSFYENHEWTEENISHYYQKDVLSNISADDRKVWMEDYYEPLKKQCYRLQTVRVNAPAVSAVLAAKKLRAKINNISVRGKE